MKRYIPLLENSWVEPNKESVVKINEFAQIISNTGLIDPEEINSNPQLQKTISELKNEIINLYSEDVTESEINERYIYIHVSGDNSEGSEMEDSEDGKTDVNLFHFTIESIQIAHKDNGAEFVDMTELWAEGIENKVLQLWGERWTDYYEIKSTEDSLNRYR